MEIEILPGVKVIIDTEKYDVRNALRASLSPDMTDYTIQIDATITDVIEKTESKVTGALVLRAK